MKKTLQKILSISMLLSIMTTITFAANAQSSYRGIETMSYCTAPQFYDVHTSAWYYNDVTAMVNAGIMKGKQAGKFDPEGEITNAEIAQIIYNLGVEDASSEYPEFGDVQQNAWYFPVVKAYGFYFPTHWNRYEGSAYFFPDSPISREDFAYTLLRICGFSETEITETYKDITGDTYTYGWKYTPKYALRVMTEIGIIAGYGNGDYGELDTVSRSQCAAILNRMLHWLEEIGSLENSASNSTDDAGVITLNTDFYSIKIPKTWESYYDYSYRNLPEGGNAFTLYEKQSLNDGYGGVLFTVLLLPEGKEYDLMEYEEIGSLDLSENGRYRVIIRYPTDVEFSDAGMERYLLFRNDIEKILNSFQVRPEISGTYISNK